MLMEFPTWVILAGEVVVGETEIIIYLLNVKLIIRYTSEHIVMSLQK